MGFVGGTSVGMGRAKGVEGVRTCMEGGLKGRGEMWTGGMGGMG